MRINERYDLAAILALIQTEFADMEGRIDPPSSMHRLNVNSIAEMASTGDVFVIEESGGPIACLFGAAKAECYYLGKIAVAKKARGRGHARKLIEATVPYAQANAAKYLELEVRVELTENHAAFGRMGFLKSGETSHAGYDKATSITMRRSLT